MPYVLSAVAAHTNPASARTSIGRPRRPSASEPFLPRPSAHVLSCHLASFVRIRPAPPNRSCNLQRARLCCGRRFFFFLCAARASAVCGFFTTTTRSFDAPRRFDQGVRACAPVSPCVLLFPSASRIVRATRHVRLAPTWKRESKMCAQILYIRGSEVRSRCVRELEYM